MLIKFSPANGKVTTVLNLVISRAHQSVPGSFLSVYLRVCLSPIHTFIRYSLSIWSFNVDFLSLSPRYFPSFPFFKFHSHLVSLSVLYSFVLSSSILIIFFNCLYLCWYIHVCFYMYLCSDSDNTYKHTYICIYPWQRTHFLY